MPDKVDNRPFEERVQSFKSMVQAIGLNVGGDEEYDIRRLGSLIVEFHSIKTDEERDKFKEEKMFPMYDKLGEVAKRNPKVGQAVVSIISAESVLN